jgi:hypothetical protein
MLRICAAPCLHVTALLGATVLCVRPPAAEVAMLSRSGWPCKARVLTCVLRGITADHGACGLQVTRRGPHSPAAHGTPSALVRDAQAVYLFPCRHTLS